VIEGAATTIRPLLPGYVLVNVDDPVFDIQGRRITYVSIKGAPLIVAEDDIDRLRETEARLMERPTPPKRPRAGDRIVIIAGAMIGRQGVIVRACRHKSYQVALGLGFTANVKTSGVQLVA
jgi:transcription antitermination factor NusG